MQTCRNSERIASNISYADGCNNAWRMFCIGWIVNGNKYQQNACSRIPLTFQNRLNMNGTKKKWMVQPLLTSGWRSVSRVRPPLAHNTGSCIDVPDMATACADCPFPITTTPANGRFSICWHRECNTFTENLQRLEVSERVSHNNICWNRFRRSPQWNIVEFTCHSLANQRKLVWAVYPMSFCQTMFPYRLVFLIMCATRFSHHP